MSSQSIILSSSVTGNVIRRIKENFQISKEYLTMEVIRKIWPYIRSPMQLRNDMGLILQSNKIKKMAEKH